MAVLNKIPIMLESWVEAVWNDNITQYHRADEPQYLSAHKCPSFHELVVSSTGFEEQERDELKQLIELHGGHFSPRMNIHRTHILLCRSSNCNSDKFLSAIKNNIPCVSKQWLLDSIEAGVALVEDDYLIKVSSSTPTKHSRPPDLEMSMISVISGPNARHMMTNSTLDSTNMSIYNRTLGSSGKIQKDNTQKNNNDQKILNIDLKQIKMAGQFLDGCSVFMVGFSSAAREKLCR